MMDDLPLPVRPTMPIFSPPQIFTHTPFSTMGVSARYRISTSVMTICAPIEQNQTKPNQIKSNQIT